MSRTLSRILRGIFSSVLIITLCLTACSMPGKSKKVQEENPEDRPLFGYALPVPIVTLNSGSITGVLADAEKITTRLYPGVFFEGDRGQFLPNRDIATVLSNSADKNAPEPEIHYRINDKARFSNNTPLLCDDFRLAVTAGKERERFGSLMPRYRSVKRIACGEDPHDVFVTVNKEIGGNYRELFGEGELLPSAFVVEKAGIAKPLSAILQDAIPEEMDALGLAWRSAFNIATTDPVDIPTLGPFKVGSLGVSDSLELIKSDTWRGDPPQEDPLRLWPLGVDYKEKIEKKQIAVADLSPQKDIEALGFPLAPSQPSPDKAPEGYIAAQYSSSRTDSLRLAPQGVFDTPEKRAAFSACINHRDIATKTSQALGVQILPTGMRTVSVTSPLASSMTDLAEHVMNYDPEPARRLLSGQRIRVAYPSYVARYEPMLNALAEGCRAAGIAIDIIPLDIRQPGLLGVDYEALLYARTNDDDATVDASGRSLRLKDLRAAEVAISRDARIIPLAAEPRTTAILPSVQSVVDNNHDAGLSWNMDRWKEEELSP